MRGEREEGWTDGGGGGRRVIAADHALQKWMKNNLKRGRDRKNKKEEGCV